ncbi:uncharacterized protein [Engystomops pustulosus]|uniref:uncharacterized protein n=1 Tax=Engystomops pustulosus TaxID=76066 RepID=UPI003AFB2005
MISLKSNLSATSVARTLLFWMNQLDSHIREGTPRASLLESIPLLKSATAFLADAAAEGVRFAAKEGALTNATRRALWLKQWGGDIRSKSKLCSIPFSGDFVFGTELDAILERASDKKGDFQRTKLLPKNLPFVPSGIPRSPFGAKEVSSLILSGVVTPVPQDQVKTGFYSPFFLVKKPNGSNRLIINLKALNNFITYSRFHMESEKVEDLRHQVHSFRRKISISIRGAMKVLGLLTACLPSVAWSQNHSRILQSWILSSLNRKSSGLDKRTIISSSVKRDLQWWLQRKNLENGVHWHCLPRLTITTDASSVGWGAVFPSHYAQGLWTPSQSRKPSNYRELRAVWEALRLNTSLLKNQHVHILSDNTTAVSYLRRQGGTRSTTLSSLTRTIFSWAEGNILCISATHLRGTLNREADYLSRREVSPNEWGINQEVFLQLTDLWGVPQIDLFATKENSVCHQYYSLEAGEPKDRLDAFSHQWIEPLSYAFPPIPLIARVLRKILSDQARILDFLQKGLEQGLSTSTLKVQVSALGAFFDCPLAEHRWHPDIQASFPRWHPDSTGVKKSPFHLSAKTPLLARKLHGIFWIIPFSGDFVFGPELDAILERASDKKGDFQRTKLLPKNLPFVPSGIPRSPFGAKIHATLIFYFFLYPLSHLAGSFISHPLRSGHPGSSRSSKDGLLLPLLPGQKTQRVKPANNKLKGLEQLHHLQSFPHGIGKSGRSETSGSLLQKEDFHLNSRSNESSRSPYRLPPIGGLEPKSFPYPTELDSQQFEPKVLRVGQENHYFIFSKKGLTVVVTKEEFGKRGPLALPSTSYNYDRRKQCGLGSGLPFPLRPGSMDTLPIQETIQLPGITGCLGSPKIKYISPKKSACTHIIRQHHGGVLSEKTRRNKVDNSFLPNAHHLLLGRGKYTLHLCNSLERNSEQGGGLPQQEGSLPQRVGHQSGSLPPTDGPVGGSSDRSLRHKRELRMPSILLSGSRGTEGSTGCLQPSMDRTSLLCLPPYSLDCKGPQKNSFRPGKGNTYLPKLAKKELVLLADILGPAATGDTTFTERPSTSGTDSSSRPRKASASSMDPESEFLTSWGLSRAVVATLKASRKKVTFAIYHKIWKKFVTFCGDNPPSQPNPNILQILDFLQKGLEQGLSTSTLKVQVSALGAFFDCPLAEHRWVKRFILASSRIRPQILRRVPTWDLKLVLDALSRPPFEPLDSATIKSLTLKTTLLIAVTTARRLGELQAISIKEPYMRVLSDRIILTLDPGFIPKVASRFHRSQEITLPSFCENPSSSKEASWHLLDVRRIVLAYLQATEPWRIDNNLFIQFQGKNKGKRASKTSIARWLKLAISTCYTMQGKEVPTNLKAHSTRAMSTSWAEKRGASLEQICKAATWASPSTFIKHYRLDLPCSQDLSFGRKVLQAVIPP